MSTQTTERPDSEATGGRTEPDRTPWPDRIRSAVERYGRDGTAAALAGGVLLAGAALASRKNARRAGILGLVGGALVLFGLRRRRSADEPTGAGEEGETSAEAEAHRKRSKVMHQSETNPRGVSGEPDVETRTDPEDGDVRFTEEQDSGPGAKPDLDGPTEGDPRRSEPSDPGTPDDHVEVDLSEAAMADEASEATGPDPEQAYPAMEGTDPEPTASAGPDRDAEQAEAGGDENGEAETDDAGGETPGDGTGEDAEGTGAVDGTGDADEEAAEDEGTT